MEANNPSDIRFSNGEALKIGDEPEMTVAQRIQELTVKVESHLETNSETRNDLRKEQAYAWDILDTLAINGPIVKNVVDELWENRNMDGYALIDLYMNVYARKQKLFGASAFEPITTQDLKDSAEKNLPLSLRHDQTQQSITIFSALGLGQRSVEKRFQMSNGAQCLAMRYLAWLSTQQFMSVLRNEISTILDTDGEIRWSEMYARAITNIEWEILAHMESRRNNYDFSIGYELEANNRKEANLKSCLFMARHIFFGADLPKSYA